MILTLHILAGFLIWKIVPSFYLAIILAFISHYLLDFLPHWQYRFKKVKQKKFFSLDSLKIILDLAIGFSLVFLLSNNIEPAAFLVILAANFPDGITVLNILLPFSFLQKEEHFHKSIQHRKNPFKKEKTYKVFRFFVEFLILLFFISFLLLQ